MKRFCSFLIIAFACAVFSLSAYAQGIPAKAFENIIIHKADGSTVEDGTIVWRDGRIESAGKNIDIPFDAEVWDGGDSLHVYPGFIDGNAYWGSPDREGYESTPKERGNPSYKRAGIRPERHAHESVRMSSDDFKTAMKAGFTNAALARKGYMIPGQLDLVMLHPELEIGDIYKAGVGMQMQFEESNGVYPSTVMGIMARLEQLMMDAGAMKQQQEYYASGPTQISAPENDPVLEALYPVMEKEQRVFFKADSKEMIERVFTLQDELGFDVVIVSGMEAYKVADDLNKRNIPVLASINFPEKPKWKKDEDDDEDEGEDKEKGDEAEEKEEEVEVTEEMQAYRDKRWEAYQKRYKNIKSLMDAGVEVGFASVDLELKDMGDRMKDWKEYGDITEQEMLKVMTSNTAAILNSGQTLGGLQKGKVAGFTVMTKPFTEKEVKALYSVSGGELHEFEEEN